MLARLYTSFIQDDRSRRRHLTDKFDDWVGHLNNILARVGGNLKDPIFESSNTRALPGGGGGGGVEMLKFRIDRRISDCLSSQKKKKDVFAANFAIDFNLLWTESRGVCSEIFKMVERFCLSMVEVQERRLLAFFQFANSVTFKGHFRQEKSSSKKYRTFKRKTA